MTRLSIIDILGVLINVSKQSYFFIVLLVVLIMLGLGLTFINPKNEKKYKILYISIISIILVFLVVSYYSSLGKMFNYMMNNFFIAALFPNVAIYLAAIISMNIIVWISVFNYRSARPIRNLNITIYCIMSYILALLSHVIISNKLDVYSQESIYNNTDARALIELSSLIFIVWIIFLVLYKIILVYIRKDYKPKVKKIIVHKREKILPNNFLPVDTPTTVFGRAPHQTAIVKEIKVEEPKESVKEEKQEDKFTIDEYKLFYEILRNEQKRNQFKKEQSTSNRYVATDNKTKEEIYGTPNRNITEEKHIVPKQEEIVDESEKQINQLDQLINNIKQEEVAANERKQQEVVETIPEIVEEKPQEIVETIPEIVVEKPQEVVETINKEIEEVIEEPKEEIVTNSISQIIKSDHIDDNENKVEIERKYETEPIPEITSLDSYRDAQKQEIIKMEEERRELLKQEQLRIEQEKQEKLLEQERQEKIRQEHLLEMQKVEEKRMEQLLQEKLLEEEREQEKLTELERLYRSIR